MCFFSLSLVSVTASLLLAAWDKIRDNSNPDVDWLICGYDGNSKTDITVLHSGSGGIAECARHLLQDDVCFGGCRRRTGRFTKWYYAAEGASVMKKGRASMHKNGVLNVLEGCDDELAMTPELADSDL
jgi:hypothetical protein